jgi:flagella basal body P-ring formation protein FlgA
MSDIDPHAVHRALQEVAGDRVIEIVEIAKTRVPAGRLRFDPRGLTAVSSTSGVFLWRGAVEYGERLRFPIWARVRVSRQAPCALVTERLNHGTVITAALLRSAEEPLPVNVTANCLTGADAVGKRSRRVIRAGEHLSVIDVEAVPAISPGDDVAVDVYNGRAHLSFIAKAEGHGAQGDQIFLRNPRSGKRFSARISAPGRAEVGAATGTID